MLAELDDGKVVQRKKYGRLLLEVKHSLQKRVDMGNLGLKNQGYLSLPLVMETYFSNA
jgi:hypothetical protein